ncbi:hypothetical protein XA68_13226 [Ophiocordyceps unilateralis]|uniref:histone acetyltransferase n=1 Tax=Ophiocordyceps unilateralis TaxID=268505 RepID=A0A2A9PC25_OPHUN|nr:hypothetical protein XA68_13226 [Ophiocordyceps unilateralis]
MAPKRKRQAPTAVMDADTPSPPSRRATRNKVSRPAPAPEQQTPPTTTTTTNRPSDLVAPEITYHVPQPGERAEQAFSSASALVRPHGPLASQQQQQQQQQQLSRTGLSASSSSLSLTSSSSSSSGKQKERKAEMRLSKQKKKSFQPRADRNIDKVVLGNLCFRTWYPSHYGKDVLGESSSAQTTTPSSSIKRDGRPMLDRLYVCPCCFKYAKELVAWRRHVRLCEARRHVPGSKIYVHPAGRRKIAAAHETKTPGVKRKRESDVGLVGDEGEWSIWEVDGDKDGLFCQNLSLFAKLFLDNKSVFFDVSGFNYFLLVFTPPKATSSYTPPPRITGFFSKEKLSWDNNNLACILIFPPWQRKGLGALLMGASYEISRREGVMGGPEKPISDLGRRGYRRFWAGEIARWLLGLQVGVGAGETVVAVDDVSRATWIAAEDCLATLRDMGVVEDAGLDPLQPPPKQSSAPLAAIPVETSSSSPLPLSDDDDDVGDARRQQDEPQASLLPNQGDRRRVRLDKEAVRRFVAAQSISLERACDAHGFLDGYAQRMKAEGGAGEKNAAEA